MASLAAWWVGLTGVQNLENVVQDSITRLTPAAAVPHNITIVDIDETSLAQLGPWPWPRNVIASLMQALHDQGVQAQVWDLVWPEPRAHDNAIQRQLDRGQAEGRPIVMGQILVVDPEVPPLPETGRLWPAPASGLSCSQHSPVVGSIGNANSLRPYHVGHISATPGLDGMLRQLPAVICQQGHAYPQLVLATLAALHPNAPWEYSTQHSFWTGRHTLRRGPATVSLTPAGHLRVPYARPHGDWPAISAHRLLDGSLAPGSLQNHTVLVGATALGLSDHVSTPYHANAPGISVHAELLAAAQTGQWYVPGLAAPWLAWLITCGVGGLWLLVGRAARWSALAGYAWFSLAWPWPVIFTIAWLGRYWGHPLPVVAPAIAMLALMAAQMLLRFERQRQDAQRMVQHLQSFLPRELADQIAQQHPNSDSLGKPCQGTLLAIHVGGLARWSARVDSLQALGLMHGIASAIEAASAQQGGRLEHLQEETLWVSWPQHQTPQAAIATAHNIQTSLRAVLERNEVEHSLLSLRCAIETGPYLHGVVGVAGSRHTVLLGPVTERLHGMLALIDELACPILLGPAAVTGLQCYTTLPFELHTIGQFQLPDSRHPVILSRVNWKPTA